MRYTVPAIIIAAAFGPYVLPSYGIRLEHIAVYLLFATGLVIVMARGRVPYAYTVLSFFIVLLVFATLWTGIATVAMAGDDRSPVKVIAHGENYIQPIAVILGVVTLLGARSPSQIKIILERIAKLLIGLLTAHTAFVIASISLDVSFLAGFFIAEPEVSDSVWARSASLGRHLGIFGQPVESGLMYSLGALLWVYLTRKARIIPFPGYLSALALLAGGVLSVSKVFIFGGLPMALAYWFWGRVSTRFINWRLLAIGVLVGVPLVVALKGWRGAQYLGRFGSINDISELSQAVVLLTAGRFGSEQTLPKELFARVWSKAPITGVGFGAETTLDNGYAEFFVQGGVVGLAAYILILCGMVWTAFGTLRRSPEEGRLLILLCVLVLLAGIGTPVLTANRVSSVLWVILTLLCALSEGARQIRRGIIGRRVHKLPLARAVT